MRILIAAMFLGAAVGAGWAQDVEKGKEEPKAPAKKDGDKKEGGGEGANAGFLTLDQVDTNGDGKVTRAELEAALKKLGGGEGDRKPDGAGKKKAGAGDLKEGEAPKRPDAPKKEGEKEGDKKPPPEKKEGDK